MVGVVMRFTQSAGTICLPCQTPPASASWPTFRRSRGSSRQPGRGARLAVPLIAHSLGPKPIGSNSTRRA